MEYIIKQPYFAKFFRNRQTDYSYSPPKKVCPVQKALKCTLKVMWLLSTPVVLNLF